MDYKKQLEQYLFYLDKEMKNQKYGVYVLENGSETNIQWNKKKNIYLDDNQIKKIKGMKI